jgi:hypothetical protein
MKVDPILHEIEAVKERLEEQAGGDLRQFLNQMDTWLAEHPQAGPSVTTPDELQQRLRHRAATEPPPAPAAPYKVYDPIVAEVHRIRATLSRERENASLILKDQPPASSTNSTGAWDASSH